jgi:YD repeat-containing protein
MSLNESVDLVKHAFENAETGDLLIRKAPAATIQVLLSALLELFEEKGAISAEVKTIGVRHGEKLFESLLGAEEMAKAEDLENYFRVPLDTRTLDYGVLFEKDGRYPVNATQLSTYYTNSGNPKESFIRESTNQVTTYLWGYNHALPIAEIKNANYATVVGVVGQAVIDNLASTNNLTDAQIRSALAPLYSLSNALTTIYTYNPLIGITSVTPPDGLISTYEYDKLGRLQFIKNNKGEIVKGYKYGYKSN